MLQDNFGNFCEPENAEPAGEERIFPAKISLAMAYVPYQRFENLYDDEKALARGTLFSALDLPFTGGKKK